jgi:predicted acylesterase/phospholipase RssA
MSLRTLALLGAILTASSPPAHGQQQPIDVRLGTVSYEITEGQVNQYQGLFRKDGPIRVRVAPGTYAEVLHWLDRGLIDAAVLTPALYAETLKQPPADAPRAHAECRYLASEVSNVPGRNPYRYRGVCLVRKGSPLREFANLKKAALEKRVRFLLVDRLSTSGHLAQRSALLNEAQVALSEDQIEYTYSHIGSLERLARGPQGGTELAAFVSEDAKLPATASGQELLERVRDFPGLDTEQYAIPQNVWVARPGFKGSEALRQFLRNCKSNGKQYDCNRKEIDQELYERIGQWTDQLGAAVDKPASLDEIGSLLGHYRHEHPTTGPRLALVLSGGGAKCSYQAGAVREIEKKLGNDISLVVGTSGGAINAVPVALGVAKNDPDLLENEWLALDLRDLTQPPESVCILLGVLLACGIALLWGGLWWAVRNRRAWLRWPASLVPLAVLVLPWISSEWIDRHDGLRYLEVVLRFGFFWMALILIALVALVLLKWVRVRFVLAVAFVGVLASLVALPLVLAFGSETLFIQKGMKGVFARRYTNLTRGSVGELDLPQGASDERRLAELSRAIVARIASEDNPLKRDLVITGTCLPPRPPGLESSDLYFYLPAARGDAAIEPRFGDRGIALADRPETLMQVVMGSGTIYPGFPASTIDRFPRDGEQVKLIDGGFAHNSPVEAAVQWGATHIILVEASPKSELEQERAHSASGGRRAWHSLWHNAGEAFNHLYDQAQLLDARSREKVAIFTLRPKTWHLTVIDFSRGKMHDAIRAGEEDAAGANFERQHGEPRFLETAEKVR